LPVFIKNQYNDINASPSNNPVKKLCLISAYLQ